MMTSLAQNFSHPGGMQQHPGVPQGHPMAVNHNPNQQVQGQPGPMPQQMHMGVSGPGGPQVSQAGAMMGGMPPGVGGPSAHALQHLNPGAQQQALFQQQQQMFANNPQLQQMQQQQIINHQRQQAAARQAMLAQQYSGIPQGMPNGMNMTPAQYQAMRGGNPMARPVNLPQHLQAQQQQAQQQAQHSLEQQQQAQAQAQQQHQHQQQLMITQQMALQHQANAQAGNNQGQPNMNPQQLQNIQQAQIAAQQAHQQQQQHAAANQQNQPQPQQQQNQQNAQAQGQQNPQQPQGPQQSMPQQQQQAAAAAMLQQQQRQQGEKLKGQCIMKLLLFADHLSNFGGTKQRDDLNYWLMFVDRFFSPKGVLRHSVHIVDEDSNKQYEITFPALARYFHTHFESGVKKMQMIVEKGSEKELPNNGHYIESSKSSFVYWFDNGSQLIANGGLKAHFDAEQKIELLEFITTGHEEYLPRTRIIEAARPLHEWQKEWKKLNNPPDGKPSPEMNKKRPKVMKSPPQQPPEIDLPASKVKPSMGITQSVFRFLEIAEVMGQMNPLFGYSHQHTSLAPYVALDQYVATVAANANNPGASPAAAHLQLPASPHVGGSPAQAANMQLQHSQQGGSSASHSATTSPNANNKRRRPSAVKAEGEENQVNGTQTKTSVKPSPRIGKRQKGNPA